IINALSLSLVRPKALFVLIFIQVSLCFSRNLSKAKCGDFEREMQKRPPTELMTVRHACDGP
ncbi:hypothetical protein, partial [Acinetobacter baumannii]|uniref:hypothetical protein n=1 Tax=Acinetobacter baumannii TaxID=470 RepID=UPI0033941F98